MVGAWLSHLRYLSHYAIVQREQASWKPVWDAKLMRTDSAGRRV